LLGFNVHSFKDKRKQRKSKLMRKQISCSSLNNLDSGRCEAGKQQQQQQQYDDFVADLLKKRGIIRE